MLIDIPADCEMHVVIRFLNSKSIHSGEIHPQLGIDGNVYVSGYSMKEGPMSMTRIKEVDNYICEYR